VQYTYPLGRKAMPVMALVGALAALTSVLPATAAETALPKPEKLNYKETKLANGLKVVTLEDHHAPVITLQVWYHVGSKDEARGKAGFAHLFEHLMFKGSEHVPAQGHARYVEQLGGDYNANTSFDRTLYYETVPSNALDRMLFLEADRMASLRVDEANMKSERDVVKEEHRMGVENAPYGKLFEDVQAMVFAPSHPYAHTTIGIMADLDSALLTDVRAFHDEYYKPDNATLVLAGDFKTSEALEKIRTYFGPIPKSTKKFTRYPVPSGAQAAEKRATFYDKLAPLPAIGMAFQVPPANDPDTPVFNIMSQILSNGQSSRLYRSLVRDKQLAVNASGGAISLRLGGLFFFFAIANAGKAPAEVEKALVEQIDLLQSRPVSEAELIKAKNQTLTSRVLGSLSTEAKASQLGQADLDYDTPAEANREFAKLTAVTAADIQRVAKKYFEPAHRNIFYVLPASMQKPGGAATSGPEK
jgi:zinc protease